MRLIACVPCGGGAVYGAQDTTGAIRYAENAGTVRVGGSDDMQIWNRIKNLLRTEDLSDGDDQARMTRIQRAYDEDHQQVATLALAEYLNLLSGVPLPTAQQRSEFAEFLSTVHSWYKHLPPNLPGEPFHFFIDKYAGCDRLLHENGTAVLVERGERGFHYSDLPTTEYRSRFGYLAFSCSSGTTVFVAGWPLVYSRDKVAAVPGDDGKMYGVPREILEVGEAHLTAIIHPCASCYPVCNSLADWPEESGGRMALEKIAARCREMRDPAIPNSGRYTRVIGYADPSLDSLVAPERRRQQRESVRSIDRVCELIQASGPILICSDTYSGRYLVRT